MNRSFIFGFWCGRVFDSRSGFVRGSCRIALPPHKTGLRRTRRLAGILFRSVAGMCKSPGRYGCPGRKRNAAGRSVVVFGAKSGPEGRFSPCRAACLYRSRRLADRQRRHRFGVTGLPYLLGCSVYNEQPFPGQRPSRATSAITLSRYCPYWFLSMGSAASRSFSSEIQPLR